MEVDFMYRKARKSNCNNGNSEKKYINWEKQEAFFIDWNSLRTKNVNGKLLKKRLTKGSPGNSVSSIKSPRKWFWLDICPWKPVYWIRYQSDWISRRRLRGNFFILVGPMETEFKNGKHKGNNFKHSKLMKINFIKNMSLDCILNWWQTSYSSSFYEKPMRKKTVVFKSMKPKSMTKIVRILTSLSKMRKKHFVGEKSMETTLTATSSKASNVLYLNSGVITFIDEITKNIDFIW